MLLLEYEEDQGSLKNSIQDVRESMPASLAASFEKPCKETAVQEYVSRFAQRWKFIQRSLGRYFYLEYSLQDSKFSLQNYLSVFLIEANPNRVR